MNDIYKVLDKLNIKYEEVEHKKVFTSEQAEYIKEMIEGMGVKNLFLENKGNYYLYLIDDAKKADLKLLSKEMNLGRLHFASEEELYNKLKLEIGSVTPLGLINDNASVELIISKDLVGKKLLFHPNRNTATISMEYKDLLKFIEYCKNSYNVI